jgi:hypothetical protein
VLKWSVLAFGLAFALPSMGACPAESQLAYIRSKGVEMSSPLTATQVEALTKTGPDGMSGTYAPTDPEWQELKAKHRKGDYFVQFWRGRALVERTKFYMDGLYLVRSGCVIGWLKGAVS